MLKARIKRNYNYRSKCHASRAKDNTTSVDAYSFGMPLKVTYIDKATFNDELKKEEKYDIKGTIKATVNNKKKRHTLNLILIILLVILVLAQPLLLPF